MYEDRRRHDDPQRPWRRRSRVHLQIARPAPGRKGHAINASS